MNFFHDCYKLSFSSLLSLFCCHHYHRHLFHLLSLTLFSSELPHFLFNINFFFSFTAICTTVTFYSTFFFTITIIIHPFIIYFTLSPFLSHSFLFIPQVFFIVMALSLILILHCSITIISLYLLISCLSSVFWLQFFCAPINFLSVHNFISSGLSFEIYQD